METLRDKVIKALEAQGYVNFIYDIGQRTGEKSNMWKAGDHTFTLYSCTYEYRHHGSLILKGDQFDLLKSFGG